jgi:hypothetical protein
VIVDPTSPSTYYTTGALYYYDGSAYTYYFVVSKSTDGGTSWHRDTLQTSASYMYGYSVAVQPSATYLVYAAGYNGLFYKSTNAGSTWSLLNSGLSTAYYIYDIAPHPTNTNIIYLAASNGIFKTTDAGVAWTKMGTLTGVNDILIHPRGPDTVYAGANTGFYKSTNAGVNWTAINGGLLDTYVTSLAFNPGGVFRADSSFIFAGTQGGGMHRMFLMLIPVAEERGDETKICFTIESNPARDHARFRYSLDHSSRVEVKIYDAGGRLVETLVESRKNAGTYNADWDCHTQAVGIYFVKMVSDDAQEVHKLILVD